MSAQAQNPCGGLAGRPSGGIVVLDVDGVIFPGQLILSLARRRGVGSFLRTLCDCLLFNVGRIGVEELLNRSFRRLRGMSWEEVCRTYRRMAILPGSAEAIAAMRAAGRRVILLTAGVPDPLVKDLAARLGADLGAGMRLELKGGRLTGRVSGELARPTGKLDFVARAVEAAGLSWKDVTAVGDDRNNLPLMRRAGVSIGFRATQLVRREALALVDADDLTAILPRALEPAPGAELGRTGELGEKCGLPDRARAVRSWHREILRKTLHLPGAAVPFLAARAPLGTTALLLVCAAIYAVMEFWRLNGARLPLVRRLDKWVLRGNESRRAATAPLTLALGMLVALWCLPPLIAFPCILIAAVADSAASIVGARWGRAFWPYNRMKSLEGSTAFLISAVVCGWVYLPLPRALLLAVTAAALESLPLQDWDNFVTPVGTGLIAAALLGPA